MLYIVERYEPNAYSMSYNLTDTRVLGTEKSARLLAAEWLPAVEETDYSARVTRHSFVRVRRVKCGRIGGTEVSRTVIETPIHYVPSVGDLGYSP